MTAQSVDTIAIGLPRRNIAIVRLVGSDGGCVEAEYELTGAAGNLLDLVECRIYREELVSHTGPQASSHTENYETQIQKMPENSPKFESR